MSGASRAELIACGAARLSDARVPGAERDARLLYRWAASMDGAGLLTRLTEPATSSEADRFEQAI